MIQTLSSTTFSTSIFSISNFNDAENNEIIAQRSIFVRQTFEFYIKANMQNLRLWKNVVRDFVKWNVKHWNFINDVIVNFVKSCCYFNELWIEIKNDNTKIWNQSMMFIVRDKLHQDWNLKQIKWIKNNYDNISFFMKWQKNDFINSIKTIKIKRRTTMFKIMKQSILKRRFDFSIVTIDQKQQTNFLKLIDTEYSKNTDQVSQVESIHEHVFKSIQKVIKWTAYR